MIDKILAQNIPGDYSGSGVQSSAFRVKDKDGIEDPILSNEFKNVCEQARRTRAVVRGFINCLKKEE